MNKLDIINALFEAFGAYVAWKNFFSLVKDREIKGVYWPVWGFFTLWGAWNVFYYPALGQWWSFAAGVALLLGNASWTVLAARLMMFADFEDRSSTGPLKPLVAVWNADKKRYEYVECLTPAQVQAEFDTAETMRFERARLFPGLDHPDLYGRTEANIQLDPTWENGRNS